MRLKRVNWLSRLVNVARWRLGRVLNGLFEQYPDLANREHVLAVRSDDSVQFGGTFQRASDNYNYHAWTQKAVGVWGSSIAPLALRVTHKGEAVTHPLNALLDMPNPDMDSSDLWRWWATDMALGGEHGLEFVSSRAGQIAECYPRQPDGFHVRPDEGRRRYWKVAEYRLFPDEQYAYNLRPDEFLHFKFYNPLQPYRGVSPASAVRLAVIIDELVQVWSRQFFSNGARPDYAIIAPQGITPMERDDIEFRLSRKFGGSLNAHKPIVLEEGVTDIKTFSFPRGDAQWMEQRKLSRDEVGAIYGVPDEIMGFGHNTYENFDTAERVLWSLTLINLINFRDSRLTNFFRNRGLLGPGEAVTTDVSRVWALRRAAAVQMKDALSLSRMGVPFNIIDKKLGLGVGDVPGGNEPFRRSWADGQADGVGGANGE